MPKNPDSSRYLELPHSSAYQRHSIEEIQHGRTFVDRHYYRVLLDSMVNDLYDPKQKQLKLLEEAWSAAENSDTSKPGWKSDIYSDLPDCFLPNLKSMPFN